MAHTLKVDNPDMPNGTELTIPGLPVMLVNGKSVEVDEDAEKQFEDFSGHTLTENLKGHTWLKLTAKKGGD